jgi:hypothetical protein
VSAPDSSSRNPCPFDTPRRWVERLEQEFFLQGDVERAHGMAISPLFDRNHAGITRSQVRPGRRVLRAARLPSARRP